MMTPSPSEPRSRRVLRAVVALAAGFVALWTVPQWLAGWDGQAWFDGDPDLQQALARGVEQRVADGLGTDDFGTGSELFDGEWVFGSFMMAGMGFGQLAADDPAWMPALESTLDRLLDERVRQFDTRSWKADALTTLGSNQGHVAYLGYAGLVFGLHRTLRPESRFNLVHDRMVAALIRRLERAPHLLIETYPGEVYPVDNAAAIGAIALHDRATGQDHSDLIARWVAACRTRYVDADTGLLVQAVDPVSALPVDSPRGSGTFLASYFLSFVDDPLSGELFEAARRELHGGVLGFGMMREYPVGDSGGGDIDSGPVILGYGVSATGFALGPARAHGDAHVFTDCYETAALFGAPQTEGDALGFVTGGPLGDAILFAMLTARPATAGGTE